MRSGQLRHRVQIQARSTAQDDFGQPLDQWTTVIKRWASVDPISGREFIAKSGEAADTTHKIMIRTFTGLLPSHRILIGARVFDIQHIANWQERGVYMQLICRERIA